MPNTAGTILLEDGTGGYQLEDGTGTLLLESPLRLHNFLFPHSSGLSVTSGIRALLVALLGWGGA